MEHSATKDKGKHCQNHSADDTVRCSLIYSSTGTAYEGGSEGKTEKGGSLVVQGRKDSSTGTRRDVSEMRRESPKEIPDSGDSGLARGAVTRSAKVKRYRGRRTAHMTRGDERDY